MIEFVELLESVGSSNLARDSKSMKNAHDYRNRLCESRLQQIYAVQKFKRVHSLKEKMNNNLKSPSISESKSRSFSFDYDQLLLGEAETQLLEEEMKMENLADYQDLLTAFQSFQEEWMNSASSSEESVVKTRLALSPKSKSVPNQSRKFKPKMTAKEPSNSRHSSENLSFDKTEEKEEETSPRVEPSPSTPRIRYPRGKGKAMSNRRYPPSLPPFSDEETEDNEEKDSQRYGPVCNSEVQVNHRSHPHPNGQSPPHHPLTYSLPLISEEITWEIRLPKSLMIADSKLFFFQNFLWRLTFGLNPSIPDYYYFYLAPAEKLKKFISLKVDFLLYSTVANTSMITPSDKSNTNGRPPLKSTNPWNDSKGTTASSMKKASPAASTTRGKPDKFVISARENFTFPVEVTISRGYDRFISREELLSFLTVDGSSSDTSAVNTNTNNNTIPSSLTSPSTATAAANHYLLKLAVIISTNLGPNGELIGCLTV